MRDDNPAFRVGNPRLASRSAFHRPADDSTGPGDTSMSGTPEARVPGTPGRRAARWSRGVPGLLAIALTLLASLSGMAAPPHRGAALPGRLGAGRPSLPLAVDSLFAATYLGGTGEDGYRDVSVVIEPGGTVLVAGSTMSSDFPTTAGAYDGSHNGGCDVFIARFDGRLTTLLAATFFGGSGDDGAWPGVELVEDGLGRIYIAGTTTSTGLPTPPGAYDTSYNGGGDLFVACFSAGLDSLLTCTYLGGSAADDEVHLVLGGGTDLYLAGFTASANYPTTVGAYDRTRTGATDAFATRLSRDLTTLMASTYLGGTYEEYGTCVLWDPRGYLYVAGITNTYGFPTTPGAYDRQVNSNPAEVDVFLSRFSADLSALSASTFLGGSNTDFPYALAVGTTGDIFVTGHVQSTDFPTTPSAFDRTYNSAPGDNDDVFVSRFSPNLGQLIASTYLGGSGWDWAITFALDGRGHLFVGGETWSSDFPTTPGSLSETPPGGPAGHEGFVSRLDEDLTTLEASTYLGGGGNDLVSRIVVDPVGDILLAGGSGSSDFPMNPAGYDTTFSGGASRWGGDVVLVRLDGLLTGHGASAAIEGADPVRGDVSLDVAPNPMGAVASIRFGVQHCGQVILAVFDVQGRRVSTLLEGRIEPGNYTQSWNGRGDSGRELSPGVYFLRLTVGDAGGASSRVVLR